MEKAPEAFQFAQQPQIVRGPSTVSIPMSRQIEWNGGRATSQLIDFMQYEADVVPRTLQLLFAFRSRVALGEGQSYGKVKTANAPRCAFVHPPGLEVAWRVHRVESQELVVIEFENDFVLRSAELQHLTSMQISEEWAHEDALSWQLGKAIHDECVTEGRQGLLFVETAATLLALHTVRRLTTYGKVSQVIRRGGLPPNTMRRACDYMMARLDQELSLHEVAAVADLSPGHFSFAFRKTVGMSPFAWVRRQRIERARLLLLDPSLDLKTIAALLGYANQSALGVAFKKVTGFTPTQWRRMR